MSRKLFSILIVVLILAGAGGAYVYFTQNAQAAEETTAAELQIATVRRGSLVISASGTGSVIAGSEVSLGFETSGVITELMVAVGDEVSAGDALAVLESSQSDAELTLAVTSAQIAVINAQEALDDLTNPEASSLDLASSMSQLAQLNLNLVDLQTTFDELVYQRAGMNGARCLEETIAELQEDYDDALEAYNDRPNENTLAAVDTALANLNWCSTHWTDAEIAAVDAEIALDQAQLALYQAQAAALQEEIESLQNPTTDATEIALAQAQLANAQATLELAEAARLPTTLYAASAGTILNLNVQVGDTVNSGAAILSMANLAQPMLEVYVDETDMNSIGVGYEVEVVFDALPDDVFTGVVLSIDPSLVNVSGVPAVQALVQLDVTSFAKPQNLPVGLNASVEVIGSRAENVLLVPVEAVRELAAGSYAVFVLENNEPVLRVVEVGLMDYTYAEIKSGLSEGEIVTTGIVETVE